MSDEHIMSVRSNDDSDRIWTLEHRDGAPFQEWLNANLCENFVLKLISGTDSCLTGNVLTLDGSTNIASSLMEHASKPHSSSSLSPVQLDHHSEKTVMRYIVNKSGLQTAKDNNFSDNAEGVAVQAGSPDLNVKALLQMLEKHSLPLLGETSESNQNKYHSESYGILESSCKAEIECFDKSQNLCDNGGIEVDSPMMSEKQVCEDMEVGDDWIPVGIVQNGSFNCINEKLPVMQTLQCSRYLPTSENISAEDYIGMTCQERSLHGVDTVGGDSVSHVGFSQEHTDFQLNSSARPERERKRKPLLRHYQSEFFMKPHMKQEHSPQLQLVKLVRPRTYGRTDQEENAIAAPLNHGEKGHHRTEMNKKVDDPELAFMKTVDMPSGKRVEDIYVVPSVWISNETGNAGQSSYPREAMTFAGADICHFFPVEESQRVTVYCHGSQTRFLNTFQTPYCKQAQGSLSGCQPPPSASYRNPTRKALHSTSVSNTNSFKPAQNIYKVIKGHIITTLNVPKLEPVPSLKDLCQSALRIETMTAISEMRESSKSVCIDTVMHDSGQVQTGVSAEISPDMKTSNEFLDILRATTHKNGLNLLLEKGDETECLDRESRTDTRNMSHEDTALEIDSAVAADVTGDNHLDLYSKSEMLMDNEETLPENPLFTEDIKKIDGMNTLAESSDSSCELLQTKRRVSNNVDHQSAEGYLVAGLIGTSQAEKVTVNHSTLLKDSNNDYMIPIVSYRLTDSGKRSSINNVKTDHQNSLARDESGPLFSSYPILVDDAYCSDTFEGNLMNLPSLDSVTKQIRSLSSVEPTNKSLANLAATLNLLCCAEKTLCNVNCVLYSQVKSETKTKLGHLNLCISKLGDLIVAVGGILQQWVKATSSWCFKTMGVITDMYNSNIIALIELITPYFHHICELIASCHSETVPWSKQELSAHDRPRRLADHYSVAAVTSWLYSNIDNPMSCRPEIRDDIAYANNQPAGPPQQDTSQDCDRPLFTNENSDNFLSGPRNANMSQKEKCLSNPKRGKQLASKNVQRRAGASNFKNKLKQMQSPKVSRANSGACSDKTFCGTAVDQLLPSTIMVKLSADSFLDEANATDLRKPKTIVSCSINENAISEPTTFANSDQKLVQISTSATTWLLPPGARDNHLSVPVHLSISEESCETTLSLLDSEINSDIDDSEINSVEDLKDAGSECSPSKKLKFEFSDTHVDANDCPNVVVALPEGINLVRSPSAQSGSLAGACAIDTLPLNDSSVDDLNIRPADLQGFPNVYYMHNSENPTGYLHNSENPAGYLHNSENPAGYLHNSENPAGYLHNSENPTGYLHNSENPTGYLHNSENSAGYLHNSENSAGFLQLDPHQLSVALLNTFQRHTRAV